MKDYLQIKISQFCTWIVMRSDQEHLIRQKINGLTNRIERLEKAEEERIYKDKNKDIWGDHA